MGTMLHQAVDTVESSDKHAPGLIQVLADVDRALNRDANAGPKPASDYFEAFSRHDGLLLRDEQERLRRCHVAIVGMGGVGGSHLMALARLGIGRFTIADPDRFELAN